MHNMFLCRAHKAWTVTSHEVILRIDVKKYAKVDLELDRKSKSCFGCIIDRIDKCYFQQMHHY